MDELTGLSKGSQCGAPSEKAIGSPHASSGWNTKLEVRSVVMIAVKPLRIRDGPRPLSAKRSNIVPMYVPGAAAEFCTWKELR